MHNTLKCRAKRGMGWSPTVPRDTRGESSRTQPWPWPLNAILRVEWRQHRPGYFWTSRLGQLSAVLLPSRILSFISMTLPGSAVWPSCWDHFFYAEPLWDFFSSATPTVVLNLPSLQTGVRKRNSVKFRPGRVGDALLPSLHQRVWSDSGPPLWVYLSVGCIGQISEFCLASSLLLLFLD